MTTLQAIEQLREEYAKLLQVIGSVHIVCRFLALIDRSKTARVVIFALAVAFCLAYISLPFAHAAEESRIYDAKGRYQGRATTNTANPQQKSLYDEHGKYQGRVMTDDKGNSRVYDNHGEYMGRATGQPPSVKK